MVNEIWRDIKDYPNYMVSNLGRVKSLNYRKRGEEKILKNIKIKSGYLQVELCKNRKIKKYYIHRLVAQAFIDNPNKLPCIDHINTITTDNRVENLRWVTHKENSNNSLTIDKMSKNAHFKNKFGIEHPNSKPIIQFTLDGKLVRKWNSAADIQRELGIKNSNICSCCKGKLNSSGGFIWRYYYKGIWLKTHIPLKDKMVS